MKRLQLIKEIRKWLADYELATGEVLGDEDTLDGSAYNLLNTILGHLDSK